MQYINALKEIPRQELRPLSRAYNIMLKIKSGVIHTNIINKIVTEYDPKTLEPKCNLKDIFNVYEYEKFYLIKLRSFYICTYLSPSKGVPPIVKVADFENFTPDLIQLFPFSNRYNYYQYLKDADYIRNKYLYDMKNIIRFDNIYNDSLGMEYKTVQDECILKISEKDWEIDGEIFLRFKDLFVESILHIKPRKKFERIGLNL